MTSLSQLKQFLEKQNPEKDPFWLSILQSDTRNIFPKYEVCKIEIVKNNLEKIRLIMENLNAFTTLEAQKRNQKQELQEMDLKLQVELEELKRKEISFKDSDYDTNLKKRTKQIEILCKQLSKNKLSKQTQQLLTQNPAWLHFFQRYIKKPEEVSESQKIEDNLYFCHHVPLDIRKFNPLEQSEKVKNVLTKGTTGKIYEQRLKNKFLVEKVIAREYGLQVDQSSSPQWQKQLESLKIE